MSGRGMSRRALLKGAGSVAVALPFMSSVQAFAPAARAQAAFPKRLVVWFTPNGFNEAGWPTSTSLEGTSLEPLMPYSGKTIVTKGLRMDSAYRDDLGDHSHYNGWIHMLTSNYATTEGSEGGDLLASAQSFDMLLADRHGSATPLKYSLHGVRAELSMSWLGRTAPAPADNDTARVFDRLFSDFSAPPDVRAIDRNRRRSVLDYVQGATQRLSCRLGSEDRRRLDQHLTAVRDIESRIGAEAALSCSVPDAPPGGLEYPATGRIQMDLLAHALACDITRVGGMQWSRCVAGGTPTWIGIDEDHHELSHDASEAGQDKIRRINRWYAEQLAYFMAKLDSMAEGDGTVLDNTAIVWVSELGLSTNDHKRENLGIVIAGGGGGTLKGGQFLQLDGTPHSNLWVELLDALSPESADPIESFGMPEACTGGLSEIRT